MKKVLCLVILAVLMIFYSPSVKATTIGFEPTSQEVLVGSPVDVDLMIWGLGDYTEPSLSTFDLDILFDPTILAFNSAIFGDPILGDQLDIWSFGMNAMEAFVTSPGVLYILEVSLDTVDDLHDFQADSFTLATLTFDALESGTSSLDISNMILGDAYGNVIPVPATFLLVASGLAGIGVWRRKRLFRS